MCELSHALARCIAVAVQRDHPARAAPVLAQHLALVLQLGQQGLHPPDAHAELLGQPAVANTRHRAPAGVGLQEQEQLLALQGVVVRRSPQRLRQGAAAAFDGEAERRQRVHRPARLLAPLQPPAVVRELLARGLADGPELLEDRLVQVARAAQVDEAAEDRDLDMRALDHRRGPVLRQLHDSGLRVQVLDILRGRLDRRSGRQVLDVLRGRLGRRRGSQVLRGRLGRRRGSQVLDGRRRGSQVLDGARRRRGSQVLDGARRWRRCQRRRRFPCQLPQGVYV